MRWLFRREQTEGTEQLMARLFIFWQNQSSSPTLCGLSEFLNQAMFRDKLDVLQLFYF